MFYLIESQYVGPNQKDSRGHWIGDSRVLEIRTEPGRTNMSQEVRYSGWLGTTNDCCLIAHGRYDTVEEARAEAHSMGFTAEKDIGEADQTCWGDDGPIIAEAWITPAAAREQWDAGDWFLNAMSADQVRAEYGITATSTDEELAAAAAKAESDAEIENIELHGTEKLFERLRQEVRDAAEGDSDDE